MVKNMHDVSESEAWGDETHAKVFDYLSNRPNFLIKRHYERFNEGRLLKMCSNKIKGETFFEIGCATGDLYRYISTFMNRFNYFGFDISEPAIQRAKAKYPQVEFHQLSVNIDAIANDYGRPDIIWCRDVVLHQTLPYVFLDSLITLSNEAVILRLRTRDVGKTVFEAENSCQVHWDKHWVPYIVLNIDELIAEIKKHETVGKIIISRSYEVLGGHHLRFLPKDLYFTSAGGAETAVYIHKGARTNGKVEVQYMDRNDRPKLSLFERLAIKACSFNS